MVEIKRQRKTRRSVVLELCSSKLHMAILEESGESEPIQIHTRSVVWQKRASALHTVLGVEELGAAVGQLVAEEHLEGCALQITLTGGHCVTRVATGDRDSVRRELAALEERSELYLALGHGRKVLASLIRPLDARHDHALLAVTNSRTLDALVQVTRDTNLDLVEPSLVALSRLVGYTGGDQDGPVLILYLTESEVELGISYQGYLLLDYRPAGYSTPERVAKMVMSHLSRLQRYCDRYYRYAPGHRLDRVFLFGTAEAVDAARQGFRLDSRLKVEVLDPNTIDPRWHIADASHAQELCAALGTALLSTLAPERRSGPNLMERFRLEKRVSLPLLLLRKFWPVAAVLLLSLALLGLSLHKQAQCTNLDQERAKLRPAQLQSQGLNRQIIIAQAVTGHLEWIRQRIIWADWANMLSALAQCLPEDVWLDRMTIQSGGQISLAGTSYQDNSIYEFLNWLDKAPGWNKVLLASSEQRRFQSQPAIRFTVECQYDVPEPMEEKAE